MPFGIKLRFQIKPSDIETTNIYKRQFDKRDTLIEREVNGRGRVSGDGKIMPGSTYSLYDSNGNRVLVQEENLLDTKNITTRQMVYAADGTLLQKNDGKASSLSTMVNNKVQYASITAGGVAHHFSSSGNYLGEIAKDKNGRISSSLKDQHYTGPTQTDSSNVTQYQVQSGDSLKSLALNFYGNADYWYLIANLNGLTSSPDEALSAGLSIDIPARASSTNSANSFKPMDLQKIIGDTTPSLPYVPPAPAAGCNAIATIVMVVVAVVVTAYTQNPAAGAAAGDAARQTTTAMLNGQFDWGGFVRGNLNPLNMAKKAMMVAVPAYGAYELGKALSGNDRSQALFNPLEYGFDYDYKSTAIAAAASYAGSNVGAAVGSTAGQVAGVMVQAGVSYASTVQLNRWAGRQMEFKLSAMAAGMAGAGITAGIFGADNVNGATPKAAPMAFNWREVTKAIFSAETVQRFGIGMAQNAMQYGLGKLFGDRSASWNFGNAAADSFGNALGNSIVAKAQSLEQIRSNAAAAQRGLSGAVQTKLDDNFNGQVNHNAAQIGANLFADSARQFDNAAEQRLLDADAFNQSYLDKRTGAIDGYLGMSRKTQQDIQSIDTRTATSRQQRATQAAQIQQRYYKRTMDFRMENPVHRGSAPLFDYDSALAADNAMWGDGKRRSADLSQLRQNIMNDPTGPSNAIETELNVSLNVPIVELGGGGGFTVDSYGRMTFAVDGLFSTTTNVSLSLNAQLSNVKGYGASSRDLGTGYSVSTSEDITLTEKIIDLTDMRLPAPVKALLKAKPAEVYAGREQGWTQTQMPWEKEASNQYAFDGGYVGFAAGWKNVYKIDESIINHKYSPLKYVTIGRTHELAFGYTYDQPNILGRIIYHLMDTPRK